MHPTQGRAVPAWPCCTCMHSLRVKCTLLCTRFFLRHGMHHTLLMYNPWVPLYVFTVTRALNIEYVFTVTWTFKIIKYVFTVMCMCMCMCIHMYIHMYMFIIKYIFTVTWAFKIQYKQKHIYISTCSLLRHLCLGAFIVIALTYRAHLGSKV